MPDIPLLSGIGDKLQGWQDSVVDDKMLGHGLKTAYDLMSLGGRVPVTSGADPVSALVAMGNQDDMARASQAGLSGKQWVDAAYANSPWQHVLTSAVLDPLNLVGMGLPSKALTVVPAASRAGQAFRVLDAADKLPAAVSKPVMDLAGQGIGKLFEGANAAAAPVANAFARNYPGAAEASGNVMRAWREQALLSPGYHVRNAAENLLRPILDSGDWETARETVKNMFTGRNKFDDLVSSGVRLDQDPAVLKAVGQDPTQQGVESVYRKFQFQPKPIPGGVPPMGTATTQPLTGVQNVANYATGKIADISEMNRRAGTFIEGSARKAAIANQYSRAIEQGASHAQAVDAAIDYADKLFFDYEKNTPVDQLGQNLFAFHKFATQNLPAQLAMSAEKPALMNVPANYYRVSDEYNQQHGLSSRFHGELPVGDTGFYINPLAYSSLGEMVGAATKHTPNDDEGTLLGQAADAGKELGFGLNPFLDAALTVTGQHGRTFAPGFLRASQPINGILSATLGRPVDIEGVVKDPLGDLQESLTGQQPFPYQEYLLRKRQAELKALGKDPSQAGSDVGYQMADEGMAGFLGLPSVKYLSPEEQIIRRNQELAQAYKLAGNQAGYHANPTAGAYAELDPRDEQIANWDHLSVDERQRLLRDPEVRDQLLDKLAMQLHNTGSARANISTNPLIGQAQSRGMQSRYQPQQGRR
jgi:hypothetical protein